MSSFISNFRQDAKALLVVACMLTVAELGLRHAESRLSIDVAHIRSFPDLAKRLNAGPSPRVVFLGNSLTRSAVSNEVWDDALTQLGVPKGSMVRIVPDATGISDWYYVALNHFVGSERVPDVVIVGFARQHLRDSRVDAGRLGAYFCDLNNVRELFSKDLHGVEMKAEFLMGRFSRLYGVRDELQARFGTMFIPGYQKGVQHLNDALRDAEAQRHGATASKSPETYFTLRRALELWRSVGIRTVVVAMPLPSYYEVAPAILSTLESSGATFVDARHLPITRDEFPDGYHMGPRAGEIYTRYVALHVSEVLREVHQQRNPKPEKVAMRRRFE